MVILSKTKIISFLIVGMFLATVGIPGIASLDIQTSGFTTNQDRLQTDDTLSMSSQWTSARSLHIPKDTSQPVLIRTLRQNDETILLQYSLPEPEFSTATWQVYDEQNTQQMKLGNTLLSTKPGKPEIPMIPSQIILPKGQRIDNVNIIIDERVVLPENYLLSYAQQPQPITCTSGEGPVATPDPSIYESNEPYPSHAFELHETQYAMGVAITQIDIFPVIYRPLSRTLEYFKTFTLEVVTAQDETFGTDVRVDLHRFQEKIAPMMENPDALDTYTDGLIHASYQNTLETTQSYSYVFITSQAIANDGSVNPSVSDFISYRQTGGFTATVVTTEYIYANYAGSTNSDKLRNFIKDAYNTWNTQFVTLGGDTNIIPLKTVYASFAGYSDNIPTDIPYQCLDGSTWNNDFFAEVMIGRISGQTATEISNQLYKIIQYETHQGTTDYLQTGLSVGEKLDSQTYAKLAMKELETYFSDDWEWVGLFDYDGIWAKQAIINHINSNNFSIINHLGHSNYNYNMKMYNGDESSFTNTNYIFVKSQGCIPGAFDQDCITERFTTQQKIGGMFAAVMNSRYGWYTPGNPYGGPSHQLHRSFWYAAWDLDMDYFSEYNEYSHRTHYSNYRWDVLQSNYFGCAATLFRGKEIPGNPPTATVTRPTGGEVFQYDTYENITWTATAGDDPVTSITIHYSSNGGTSWKLVETGLANTFTYSWEVPNENSNQCLVKISAIDAKGRVGEGISTSVFTIVGVAPAPPTNLAVQYISAPTLVVFDDFSDGTLDDWTIYSGSWSATNGYLQGYGSISAPAEIDEYPIEAYGRWEFDIQFTATGSTNHMRLHFIQVNNPDTTYSSGYYVFIRGDSLIRIWRWDNGNTPANPVVDASWSPSTTIRTVAVERSTSGVFSLYVDNVLLGTGIDTTYKDTDYIGFRHTQSHNVHEIRAEVLGDDNEHNQIQWDASPDDLTGWINSYNIYRSEDQDGPWDASTKIASVNANTQARYEYIDIGKGMADDILWWYVVRAVGVNGLEEMNTNAANEANNAPNKPDRPSGETSGKTNTIYTYTTRTTDTDGDQVYYLWDWGDGTQSLWLGPYDSEEEATAEHSWTTKGDYSVKVKAKDAFGGESDWSDPLPITMPKTTVLSLRLMLYQLLEQLLQQFPNAFPLIRQLMKY